MFSFSANAATETMASFGLMTMCLFLALDQLKQTIFAL